MQIRKINLLNIHKKKKQMIEDQTNIYVDSMYKKTAMSVKSKNRDMF